MIQYFVRQYWDNLGMSIMDEIANDSIPGRIVYRPHLKFDQAKLGDTAETLPYCTKYTIIQSTAFDD